MKELDLAQSIKLLWVCVWGGVRKRQHEKRQPCVAIYKPRQPKKKRSTGFKQLYSEENYQLSIDFLK